MQTKKKRTKLAKVLRKLTGLPFVTSLTVAKNLLRGTEFNLTLEQGVGYVTYCECCGPEPVVRGPKGTLSIAQARREAMV